LFNPFRGVWDARLLRRFGVPRRGLPRVLPAARYSLPLRRGLPALRASLGDQQAALAAARLAAPGACLVNYGTGAFVLAGGSRATRRPPRGLLLAEAVDADGKPCRALEAPLPTAAAAFGSIRTASRGSNASAVSLPPPLLVAATHGLGAPWWLDRAPSLLLFEAPLDARQVEAAAEFSIAASVQAAIDRLPTTPKRLLATGGLAGRDRLMSLQATLAGRTMWRPSFGEWSALGAALLAAGPDRPPLWRLEFDRFPPRPRRARREARARYALWLQGARFLASLDRRAPV
jgi:glycerol kinase